MDRFGKIGLHDSEIRNSDLGAYQARYRTTPLNPAIFPDRILLPSPLTIRYKRYNRYNRYRRTQKSATQAMRLQPSI